MSDQIPYSRKDQRQMTAFVGQELLYDYICRKLDPDRMRSIETLVSQSREVQDEIQAINQALVYVEHLGETEISAILLEKVKAPTSYIQGLLQKVRFGDWPVGLKLGLEVLLVSLFVFSAIIIVPWNRVMNFQWGSGGEVTLVEVQKEFQKKTELTLESNSSNEVKETKQAPEFQDDSDTKKPAPSNPATGAVAAKTVTPPPTPVAASTPVSTPAEEGKPAASQGYLYRGTIQVSNLGATTEKFVEKISDLGGRKAGEVALGWKKPEGTYFHFTIPEAKYEGLTKYLNEYGKLKITREKHERIMPDGIVRIIITVSEDKKAKP